MRDASEKLRRGPWPELPHSPAALIIADPLPFLPLSLGLHGQLSPATINATLALPFHLRSAPCGKGRFIMLPLPGLNAFHVLHVKQDKQRIIPIGSGVITC